MRNSELGLTSFWQQCLWWLTVVTLAFSLFVLSLSLAVRFMAQSDWWWGRSFDQHGVEVRTGLPRAEIDTAAIKLQEYFRSDEEFPAIAVNNALGISEPLFSDREILHLRDVKNLFNRTYDFGWAALGVIFIFVVGVFGWRRRHDFVGTLGVAGIQAGVIVAGVLFVFSTFALVGFDSAFRKFHLLFFTNDLWKLSSRDRLIQMFPQDFFFESTLLIGAAVFSTAFVVAAASWSLSRFR